MTRTTALGIVLVLLGCASGTREAKLASLKEKGDPAHPLFVGHSDQGDIVVAASHWDAMQGMAVAASDLGEKSDDKLLCARQLLTGTHVPKWICRYQSEVDDMRRQTQNWLVEPRFAPGTSGQAAPAQQNNTPLAAPPPQ